MADPKSPSSDLEPEEQDAFSEFEQLGKALHDHIEDFVEEHDLSDAVLSALLIEVAVRARMVAYATSVEKPSASGLKLELDRMRREVEDLIREGRKSAEEFIATAKAELAKAQEENDEEDDDAR